MKTFLKVLFVLVILSCVSLFVGRYVLIEKAKGHAREIVQNAGSFDGESQKIKAMTAEVHRRFSDAPARYTSLYHKARPFISNARLPEAIRVPGGVVELMTEPQGWCDNAARMLKFTLAQEGYDSRLFSLVGPRSGHVGLLVTDKSGHDVFVDPYFGLVAEKNGTLIALDNAEFENMEGLNDESDPSFYLDMDKIVMAPYGEALEISVHIPTIMNDQPIVLGGVDQNNEDVRLALHEQGMTSYFDYMGHRYDRNWTRELHADQDVRVEMTLTQEPERGVLVSDKPPAVNGKTLSWDLKKGDTLTLKDGEAKINWKRMNSYIGVDQIRFIPLNTSHDR